MRSNKILSGLALLVLSLMLFSPAWGQQFGKKGGKGGNPFGGFGGGGGMTFPGGGFGGGFGGGNPFAGGGRGDPNMMFDMLARGRPFFLVTETSRLREPLSKYLESKGITNGQVTRELFSDYNEQMKTSMTALGNM